MCGGVRGEFKCEVRPVGPRDTPIFFRISSGMIVLIPFLYCTNGIYSSLGDNDLSYNRGK